MKMLRQALLTLSLSTVAIGGFSCNGALPEDDALVGEATSALTVAEESGDVTADAAGAESDADASALAEQVGVLPEVPGEGLGVCDFQAQRARVMARYDANGDGRLGPAERQAIRDDLEDRVGHPMATRFGLRHRVHVMKRLRWAFDENNDGALSTEERTALVDALEARCQQLRARVMERFDANADGQLDDAEKQAAREAFLARVRAARQATLQKYDANGNGMLEEPERKQLVADQVAAFRARRAAVVAQFDANGDGTLDDAEKLALKKALQQRVAEGRDAE